MTIIYEPHPLTTERKAELRAQGYKIIDVAFAPKKEDEIAVPKPIEINIVEVEAQKRGRKPKE